MGVWWYSYLEGLVTLCGQIGNFKPHDMYVALVTLTSFLKKKKGVAHCIGYGLVRVRLAVCVCVHVCVCVCA